MDFIFNILWQECLLYIWIARNTAHIKIIWIKSNKYETLKFQLDSCPCLVFALSSVRLLEVIILLYEYVLAAGRALGSVAQTRSNQHQRIYNAASDSHHVCHHLRPTLHSTERPRSTLTPLILTPVRQELLYSAVYHFSLQLQSVTW
jgi:hypothetical protein